MIPNRFHFPPLQCYRNFGCSRPWGIFEDVNHIISNLGYIVYGAAFILMVQLFTLSAHIYSFNLNVKVYIKSWMLPERNSVANDHRGNFGLAQQHSIFYTMGFSMIMQVSSNATELSTLTWISREYSAASSMSAPATSAFSLTPL